MAKDFQIHDFIEDYPSQQDPDIQWKTAQRKEFNELSSSSKGSQKKGRFFNHQEFLLRYARQYDRIFNIQATGTGKSGGIINLAEFYKKNNLGVKRIFVIQPGSSNKDSFKEQVKLLSDPGEYINKKVIEAMENSVQKNVKSNINRLINEWYSIESYKIFAKDNYGQKQIEEYYSDSIFFLDEAHWFRNIGRGEDITKKEIEEVYDYFWKIFHTAKRIKVIIATATPMINTTSDFVPLINLLLPADRQLPDYIDYDKVTLEQLEPYFRGMITYIRFDNKYIEPVYRGDRLENYYHTITVASNSKGNSKIIQPVVKKIENEKITIISKPDYETGKTKTIKIPSYVKILCLKMSNHQYNTYKKHDKIRKNFDYNTMQSSLFVFPDGTIGREGEENYLMIDEKKNLVFRDKVRIRKDGKIIEKQSLKDYFPKKDLVKSLESLKMMSCKFHEYITRELHFSEQEKPGKSFCYTQYVSAGGSRLLGLLLKHFGFEELKTSGVIHDIKTDRIIGIKKRKRFIILTSEIQDIQSAINTFNSKDNMWGEYIQIIIGSEVVRDSVSINNVLRGYNMTVFWHESGMNQSESRYKRAESHKDMFYLTNKKVRVDISRLAAVEPDFDIKNVNYEKSTIDVKNYIRAEEKNIPIKLMFRKMEQTSIDAYLNYDRNVLPSDVEGSPESDYSDKYFKIWKARGPPTGREGLEKPDRKGLALNQGPGNKDMIYNTYNIFYSSEVITKVKKEIRKIFEDREVIEINSFKQYLIDKKIISNSYIFYGAIQEMIETREIIKDERNIVDYILTVNGNILSLKRFNFHQTDRISTEKNFYFDFPYQEIKSKDKEIEDIYHFFKGLDSREKILEFYIRESNYKLFQSILEDSLVRKRNNTTMEINDTIIDMMDNYYIETKIPHKYIEITEEALKGSNKKGQGRNRGEESTAGLKYVDLSEADPGYGDRHVFIHFYRPSEKTGFGITSILEGKDRKIRILDKEEFRDTSIAENFVYNYLFDKKYDIIMKKFRESRYYGSYIMRGGENEKNIKTKERSFFRIVDNSNVRNKGLTCTSGVVENLLPLVFKLDTEGEYKNLLKTKTRKHQLCDILKKLFIQKDLMFISM